MNRQGSDKGTVHGYHGGPFVGHAFTKVYEELFASRRDKAFRMLEVGIGPDEPGVLKATFLTQGQRGGSSVGWREYFPNAEIHAMDILDCGDLDRDRLTTHIANQEDRESMAKMLRDIGGPLEIIIDDGSHQSGHQQITLAALFGSLTDDGIYIIEDLDWQPELTRDQVKTADLLHELQTTGKFPSPFLTPEEQAEIERTVIVDSFHHGSGRHLGSLAVLRKRSGAEG